MGVRRPLKTRNSRWAGALAGKLATWGVRPNAISVLSVVLAGAGSAAFVLAGHAGEPATKAGFFVAAAVGIQLRLLCNMLDGMVAVEGGLRTPTGELYNEFPDRLADAVLLVAAGYAIDCVTWGAELGWLAALLAILTAYTRALAGASGVSQSFVGPMAKPHRMALLTGAALASAVEGACGFPGRALPVALVLMVAGCCVTIVRRLAQAASELRDID